MYVECGPADGNGILVSVYTSGDIDAVESVTDGNDPARVYNNVDDVWFATWDEGADRPVTFTATLANGSTQTTNAIITAEECGIDETTDVFYFFVNCAPTPNGGYIVTVAPGGDGTGPAIATVNDSLDPTRVYSESGGEWSSVWATGSNDLVTFTATADDGQEESYRTYINDDACGVTDYTVLIKDVTCSYDEKNNNVVLIVSLSGDYEEVTGVTDNDTPPNTYSQSSARPNEWRADLDASQANGTITITVTYTGGSDTYDVTLSDTFCGVPVDTPPTTTEPSGPQYNVEVDPNCEYDIEMREYVMTALISGDLEGVERVYDSLDTAASYTGPIDSIYTRIIEEENSEIPTTTVTFTALMDNGETFSSSMDISPTNCGKSYYPYIIDATCGYNAATGWLYVDVQVGYNQFDISAVGSVTDSVGGAKMPFVKISDDTWRTEQWNTDAYEVVFSADLLPGLNGNGDTLRIDTYDLGDNCVYDWPQAITVECDPTPDNGYLVKLMVGSVQAGATVSSVDDANGSVGQAPGHAEFTDWVVDQNNSNIWTAVLTRPELTSRSGTTYFTVTDSRGITGGRNAQLLTLCEKV